jgi:hypothetical protein
MAEQPNPNQAEVDWWANLAPDPFTGERAPTYDEAVRFIDRIWSDEWNLTPAQRQSLTDQFQRNPYGMLGFTQNAQDTSEINRLRGLDEQRIADRDAALAASREDYATLERDVLPGFVSDVQRFTGQTGAGDVGGQLMPGFIFKDTTYGDALQAAEGAIDTNIQNTRTNAALANVNAGVRASGKSIDRVQQAELGAGIGKAGIRSGLTTDAQQALERSRGAHRGYQTDLTKAMADLELGYQPSALQWSALQQQAPGLNAYGPRGTQFDEISGRAGLDLAGGGLAAQILLGLLGAGQTATGQGLGFIQGLLPNRG